MTKLDLLLIAPGAAKDLYGELSDKYSSIEPNIWAAMLAQSMRSKGFSAEIADMEAQGISPGDIAKLIIEQKPRLVLFVATGQNPNASSAAMTGAVDAANEIKNLSSTQKIAFVGPHVNALPIESLTEEAIDIVFTNEGVYALANVLLTDFSDSQLEKVKGIAYKNSEGIPLINPPERIVPQERLSVDLPGMALDLLPPLHHYRTSTWHCNFNDNLTSPFVSLYTSLGCIFRCSFCLPEDSLIILSRNANKQAKDVKIGDKLLGWNEETQELAETTVKNISVRKARKIYNILLSDGKRLRCTGEHPIYVNQCWVQARNLRVGDEVLVIESSDKKSFRMKTVNPSYNKDIFHKGQIKRQKAINSGKLIPYLCTTKGRKMVKKTAKHRMLTNNPSWTEENRKKISKRVSGEGNHHWKGGISVMYQQYPAEFTLALRKEIKQRDSHKCQNPLCNKMTGRMDVHHIDFNPYNCDRCNLITLCVSCHMKTNHRREYYKRYYENIMTERKECPHYVKIESIIIEHKLQDVYNFHCDKHNNYFADYVLVHNCMINMINRTNNDPSLAADSFNTFRHWEPSHIIKWFDRFAELGVRNVKIADEMFLLKPAHCIELAKLLIERDYKFNIWAYTRVNTVKEEYLEILKKAGFNWLAIGIESGSQVIREEITKGKFKDTNIREIVQKIRDYDINVGANYIYGLGHDNYDTMQETLDLSIELNTENMNCYAAMALPGSRLFFNAKDLGWELPTKYSQYGFLSYDSLPTPTEHLTAAEVLKFRDEAFHKYFEGEPYLNMIQNKFGAIALENVKKLTKIRLKRKILGD